MNKKLICVRIKNYIYESVSFAQNARQLLTNEKYLEENNSLRKICLPEVLEVLILFQALSRPKYSCDVVGMILKEIKLYASEGKYVVVFHVIYISVDSEYCDVTAWKMWNHY